jgi:hypothetical protein
MLGIEPTHLEELRKKKRFRLFFEERLIEFGHLAMAFGYKICDAVDGSIRFAVSIKRFVVAHKAYAGIVLLAILVVSAMLL